jgi:hypothetical protein
LILTFCIFENVFRISLQTCRGSVFKKKKKIDHWFNFLGFLGAKLWGALFQFGF